MELTVAEIAGRLDGKLEGDGAVSIRGVAGVRTAEAGELTFIANPRYAKSVAETGASAVLAPTDWDRPCAAPVLIRVEDPDRAFAEAATWFAPPAVEIEPGIHATAVVADDANLADGVSVGPHAVIEAGAEIGGGTVIGAGCYVGHGVRIGSNCRLYPHVSIREHCRMGDRVVLHNGTVVGSDGFGYTVDKDGVRHKIPQIGIVVIGNDVEMGANVTIDRARFGETRIGNGVKIDNMVQVAHNCVIGDHTVIAAQTGIAGSSMLGKYVTVAGQCGISGHIVIGPGAILGGQCGVSKDVPAKAIMRGSPAGPMDQMMKQEILVRRLPKMKEAVEQLAARLAALEAKLSE